MDRSPSKPAAKRKREEDPEIVGALHGEIKTSTAMSSASTTAVAPPRNGGSNDTKSRSTDDASDPSVSRVEGAYVGENSSTARDDGGTGDADMTEAQRIGGVDKINDDDAQSSVDVSDRHSATEAVGKDTINIEGTNRNDMEIRNDDGASKSNSQNQKDEDERDDDEESNGNNDDDSNSESSRSNSGDSETKGKEEENDSEDDDDEEDDESEKKPPKQPSILIRGPGGVDAVDFPLSNIKDHLICPLCKGYFRDPYTVADCLHSFCRSCLILTFRLGHRRCPTCNTSLEPDPFREVLADRTLQEVVEKIFPWMKTKEEQDEKDFYARRGIELKPEYAEEVNSPEKKRKTGLETRAAVMPNRNSSPSGVASTLETAMNDQLDFQLEPDRCGISIQQMPPLNNPSLRTSGRLRVNSIKKYLLQKLGLKDAPSSIEVLCNGDPIGDELSLTFILRTRWFNTNKILTLKYRLSEEFAVSQRKFNSTDTEEES
mmetsp:Transcript_11944/g.25204  ORF Transcript_11944/g.25204 Transcript_11944/m.25204 type:complete len:488 (-) Transcript_11944:100-1563(-)